MNTYYQNSHTKNPLLTDRQKAQDEKAKKELQENIERIKMRLKPFELELEKLNKELTEKKNFISSMQLKIHRKRKTRLLAEIQACKIQIQILST